LFLLPFAHLDRSELVIHHYTEIGTTVGLDDDPVTVRDEECRIWAVIHIPSPGFEGDDIQRSVGC